MALFEDKAPGIMRQLMADFPITVQDAAAILGNLGHECNGFKTLQEISPTAPGSRGGYGWPQWTGPRRRAYEAYCARNKLNPAADASNYAFLFVELKGSEKKAIPATVAASGLNAKVVAFEKSFLRAGIKHYPSRQEYAQRALDAWNDQTPVSGIVVAMPEEVPVSTPKPDAGSPVEKMVGAAKGAGAGAALSTVVPAVIFILQAYDAIPAGVDNAAFGAAIGTLLTALSTGILAVVQTFRSPPNGE